MTDRFSEKLMEHFLDPRNRRVIPHAHGTGICGRPGEGPFMVIQILIDKDRISDAAFQSHTCGVTVACGSVLTELLHGMEVDEAQRLTRDDIVLALGNVPPDKLHVPDAAIRALHAALNEADA
jgi:NifU-like protein involved in Fe-S cluster formation